MRTQGFNSELTILSRGLEMLLLVLTLKEQFSVYILSSHQDVGYHFSGGGWGGSVLI